MNQKIPTKSNVTSITEAISSLRKPRVRRPKQRFQNNKEPKEAKEPSLGSKGVPGFPIIEGLDKEKAIIGQGIVALNTALFEQTLHEAERLGKIRGILTKMEAGLLDEKAIMKLDAVQQLKVFEILRKDCESSVNFLERMQGNSLKIMVVFEIYKKLMETITPEGQSDTHQNLPPDIDKSKLIQVRGALLEMIK
jgi:hypothetical protein